MMKQQHEYVINHWFRGQSEGTVCLFRTASEKEWIKKVREICQKYPVQNKYSKTIVYDDMTIFSFATAGAVGAWIESGPMRKPIQVLYGVPKEAKDIVDGKKVFEE